MISVETMTRYTATCDGCKFQIFAAYKSQDSVLNDVIEDFEWYEWGMQDNGLWLCPECKEGA